MQPQAAPVIVIVEDEQSIRDMYRLKLEMAGYTVATAENGIKGLEAIKEHKPDLIMVDIRMPGMPGDEMLSRFRELDWEKDVKVVVLTNISKDEAPMNLRFLGVDRYIVKAHFTPGQVLEVVEGLLKK